MGTVRSGRPRTRRVGLLATGRATLIVAALFRPHRRFIPGLTNHLDQLQWLRRSRAQLFGVFDISVVHNLVHLVFGVAGLILARTYARAHLPDRRRLRLPGGCGSTAQRRPRPGAAPQQRRQLAAPVRRRGDDPARPDAGQRKVPPAPRAILIPPE